MMLSVALHDPPNNRLNNDGIQSPEAKWHPEDILEAVG